MARYEKQIELSKGLEAVFETPLFTGDVGNTVKLTFLLRNKPYTAEAAEVYAKRPDGKVVSLSVAMTGNTAEFTIPNNMYPEKGNAELQIALLDGEGNVLTSGVLYFEVLEGLSGQADVAGTDQYNDMTALLSQVGEGLAQIDRAEALSDEMETFLEQYGDVKNQVIANLTETELDSFLNGVALVESVAQAPEESGGYTISNKWIVIAEHENDLNTITAAQTRFYNGMIERRTGTGTNPGPYSWSGWAELIKPDYDLVIDSGTDLNPYHNTTISGKTVFFKASAVSQETVNITFSNCTIYGNNKTIGTLGTISFTNCRLYNLHASGQSNSDFTDHGNISFTNCVIEGGSANSYFDPNFTGCQCFGCSISGYYAACYAKGSVFHSCDFGGQPTGSGEGAELSFFGCRFDFGGGAITDSAACYYSGCTGTVRVSSNVTVKPSTTTNFADHNTATLEIQ